MNQIGIELNNGNDTCVGVIPINSQVLTEA